MGAPLKVLIVEDSEDDSELLVHELRRGGFDLSWTRVETEDALRAALEENAWDVVTSDYEMPRLSAPKALGVLKESGRDVPFIVVSGVISMERAVELTLHAFQKNNMANEVVVAGDGAEGLDYLFGTGKYAGLDDEPPPALILLDLQLPKIGGQEVLRKVREDERTKRIPVVILTTSDEEDDIVNGYNGGANSSMRKPVDFNEFVNAVKQLEVYWMVLNTPPPR